MRRCLPPFIAILLLAMITGCTATPTTSQVASTPTPKPAAAALEKPIYTVQRGTVLDQLDVRGRVAATLQQELFFTQDGYVKNVYVDSTDVVTQGQLIAELELGDLPNQLRQAEVELEQARHVLNRTQAQQQLAVQQAQLDLAAAKDYLTELKRPPKAAELAEARAAVERATAARDEARTAASAAKTAAELRLKQATNALPPIQVRYTDARLRWEDIEDKPDDIQYQSRKEAFYQAESELRAAELEVQQAQLAYDTAFANEAPAVRDAEAALATAQAQLDKLLEGADSIEIADAQRAIQRAELQISQAQQSGDAEIEQRVARAQLEVERLQALVDAGILIAPFNGKISSINVRPGDSVKAYQSVVQVIDDTKLEILIDGLSNENAERVGVGQEVELTFSSYKGQTFIGKVERVPTAATTGASGTKADTSFHVGFDSNKLELEVGNVATGVITLAERQDALWLPPSAVRSFDGRRFVVVRDGTKQTRRDIRVGVISLDRIEIIDGLSEGEQVVGQ